MNLYVDVGASRMNKEPGYSNEKTLIMQAKTLFMDRTLTAYKISPLKEA